MSFPIKLYFLDVICLREETPDWAKALNLWPWQDISPNLINLHWVHVNLPISLKICKILLLSYQWLPVHQSLSDIIKTSTLSPVMHLATT